MDFQYCLVPRPSNFEARFNKKRPQTYQKSSKKLVSILIQFLMHLGSQHGSQDLPKTLPKSIKIRRKKEIKIIQNFVCILNGLLEALGANMAEKAVQKGAWRLGEFGRFFGIWKGLRGLLGGLLGASCGPRADFNGFLVDF